jgi:TolB protein
MVFEICSFKVGEIIKRLFDKILFEELHLMLISIIIISSFAFDACKNNPVNSVINPPTTLPIDPYNSPIWYPNGKFIGFNHSPQYSFQDSSGFVHYELDPDSSGFWLINSDGSDMHRIFPHPLQTPTWAPNGQSIAFVSNAQIFTMGFTENGLDTSTLSELTVQGRNFFPSWSHDGKLIAYNESICNGYLSCGIWVIDTDTKQHSFITSYGNFPSWNPLQENLIYVITAVDNNGTVLGDSLWTYNMEEHSKHFLSYLHGQNYDNSSPQYSPNGKLIAFASQPIGKQVNLWVMDSSGKDLRQLTTEGMSDNSGEPFSWDPTGKYIVFTKYRFDQATVQNGTLWILNVATGQQKQLTFNVP